MPKRCRKLQKATRAAFDRERTVLESMMLFVGDYPMGIPIGSSAAQRSGVFDVDSTAMGSRSAAAPVSGDDNSSGCGLSYPLCAGKSAPTWRLSVKMLVWRR